MSKTAVIQSADEPQILSTAAMLRAAGYDRVLICGSALREQLKQAGCDTVLGVHQMEAMGYDPLDASVGMASPADMDSCDLFAEIKVRNVPKIVARWPRLEGRIVYWRVNGAQPEICPKGGDEVNLPCPVVTACLWYGTERYRHGRATDLDRTAHNAGPSRPVSLDELKGYAAEAHANRHRPDGVAYTMWPPYPRAADYLAVDRSKVEHYDPPYGLAHYVRSWGFGPIVDPVAALGVRLYGDRAPHGQIPHSTVANLARTARALVHLKSVDCPGWALYEAMLSGCPVVTSRLLNSRMLAYPLLEHASTCYEFGPPATLEYGRGEMGYDDCVTNISGALELLKDPSINRRMGANGRNRLLDLMWSADRPADVESFRSFCVRNFK